MKNKKYLSILFLILMSMFLVNSSKQVFARYGEDSQQKDSMENEVESEMENEGEDQEDEVEREDGDTGNEKTEMEANRVQLRMLKINEIEAHNAEMRAQKALELQERQVQRIQKEAELQEQKTQREQVREEKTMEIKERREEKLSEFADNLAEKVLKYYERLNQLHEKLAIKIVEASDKGADVMLAEEKLVEADALLEDAHDDAMQLVEQIRNSDVSTKNSFGHVISMVSDLKDPFREVLGLYKEVLQELRVALTN